MSNDHIILRPWLRKYSRAVNAGELFQVVSIRFAITHTLIHFRLDKGETVFFAVLTFSYILCADYPFWQSFKLSLPFVEVTIGRKTKCCKSLSAIKHSYRPLDDIMCFMPLYHMLFFLLVRTHTVKAHKIPSKVADVLLGLRNISYNWNKTVPSSVFDS